jgi:hypothetical protein
MINAYKISVRKPESKTPLRRPRKRWNDNIKITFKGMDVRVWNGFNWLRMGPSSGLLLTR